MKELFMAFSRYNSRTNAIIFDYIAAMDAEQLKSPIKAYYPTIVDTALHVLKSDVKWLHRMSGFRESPVSKDAVAPYMKGEGIDYRLVIDDLRGFAELRSRVDAAIVDLMIAVPEEAFGRDFDMEFGPGRIKRPLWQLLMQWFNHQTHHRGQVSVQLDALGIQNDFSGLLDKIG